MASMQLKFPASTSQSRLVSKHYGDETLCALRSLQQNDMLCDFTVAAEGKSVRVSVDESLPRHCAVRSTSITSSFGFCYGRPME